MKISILSGHSGERSASHTPAKVATGSVDDNQPLKLSLQYLYTIYLYTTCIYALFVYYLFTVCMLSMHYSYILSVHCLCAIYTLFIYYLCTVCIEPEAREDALRRRRASSSLTKSNSSDSSRQASKTDFDIIKLISNGAYR